MMQSAVFRCPHILVVARILCVARIIFVERARAAAALSIDLRRLPTRAHDRAVTAYQTRFE
ncbi:hypothetical+protein [Methylocapsa aurea]